MSEHINTIPVHSPKKLMAITTLISLGTMVQNLNISISNTNHNKTISYATSAINLLFLQQVMVLFDARAHAYSMQGQSEVAIEDTNQIIKYSSMSAEGYLRKADIFTVYEKQVHAIKTCKNGLQNTIPGKVQQISIEAVTQNKMEVGFIFKLPIDIVNDAIILLFAPSSLKIMA